jgi:hypothetical protein
MPLPGGWSVTIARFERTPDGGGGIGATVGFDLANPQGQIVHVGPILLAPLDVFGLTKNQMARVAWAKASPYALNLIAYTPPSPPVPDPIIGTAFNPP